VGHAVRIENKRNTIETFVGIGPRCRWENIVTIHLKGMNRRV
jgi:hypothetical protein